MLYGGKPVHYSCRSEAAFHPDPDEIETLITPRTRAIVVINPNNPTGAVYTRAELERIVELAERHHLVVFADEIYDEMLYDDARHVPLATLARNTLCGTFSGLSKVYRACGLRVGWVSFSGEKRHAREYIDAIELLAALRLCSNVPGQWAVQTALGGYQSVFDLTAPGGRLYETRRGLIESVQASRYLELTPPAGAMYAFVKVNSSGLNGFDDDRFAWELLEQKHVLVAPGSSFNVPYRDHFRTTLLPDDRVLRQVFKRIEELLHEYSGR
jgi:alanine-synthesizing transaminase